MYQKFMKSETVADRSNAMESKNHSKNGASPKSQTSRRNIMQKTFLFFAAFCISVASAFAQDVITLKNAEDIQALVQEIGETDVKYKKFDNPNGPIYTLKKSEIFMIKYANGSKEVYNIPTPEGNNVEKSGQGKTGKPRETQLEPLSIQGIKIYNSYGKKLSKDEVRNMMRNVPEALNLYNSGNSLRTTGNVFYGIEIGVIAMWSINQLNGVNGDKNSQILSSMYWYFGVALGLAIPATICRNSGKSKIENSVGVYNSGISQKYKSDMSLNFGITRSGGVGLTFNF